MDKVREFIRARRKAVVALVVSAATMAAAKWGLELSDEQTGLLTTVVTGVLVYLVPNEP